MTRKREQIQGIFNRIAPVYDQMNDGFSLGQHRIWKQMAVSWSQAKPGNTGLDLCCGSGDLAHLLAQQVRESGQVYGVDFSAQLLAIASDRPTPITIPTAPITWLEADVLELPFPEDTFDCATMGYGLRNVVDIPRSLQELHRVLKPGAVAAILDFHRPRSALLRQFQQWYLDYLVVPLAEQMGMKQEYAYINPSLERFPDGQQQVALAQAAGFTSATHYAIAGGMMGILVIQKS
jgi:demethylmenaquinone methyltransferase/2-methoxy-6-polyprenyl-1,4-benzoquinol methylase